MLKIKSAPTSSAWRSVAKAITYRVIVMCADATAIYLLTGAWRVALGFMILSNIYTTVLYVVHERVWARISWGRGGSGAGVLLPPTAKS